MKVTFKAEIQFDGKPSEATKFLEEYLSGKIGFNAKIKEITFEEE